MNIAMNNVYCNIQLLKTLILGITSHLLKVFFKHSDLLKI